MVYGGPIEANPYLFQRKSSPTKKKIVLYLYGRL